MHATLRKGNEKLETTILKDKTHCNTCCTLRNRFPSCVEIVLKTLMLIIIVTRLSLNCNLYSQMKDLKDLVLNPQYLDDMKISKFHLIAEYK